MVGVGDPVINRMGGVGDPVINRGRVVEEIQVSTEDGWGR
jgi:hypothetical protein